MKPDFPPVVFPEPQFEKLEKPSRRLIPPDPSVVAQRDQIAETWCARIASLSQEFRDLGEEERKAVFYKLEHDGRLNITGTGLKSVVESIGRYTIALPKPDIEDFTRFETKVRDFGEGDLSRGKPKNYDLVEPLKEIERGAPKDRLSQALFEKYDELVTQAQVICEIELLVPFITGRRRIPEALAAIRSEINSAFRNGTRGTLFEYEESHGSCRAVIRCTGDMFKELVEGQEWQTKIFWFDAKPEFETYHQTLKDFDITSLASIEGPEGSAPTVCVIDTGITSGNPFLEPVSRKETFRSFLKRDPDNPFDQHGHGSGVGSLVAFYALNIQPGGRNSGKVWLASAKVLDNSNQGEEERLFSKVLEEVVDYFVPMGVRIFNLSVSIRNRYWSEEAKRTVPRKSWVARKIDQLSRKHDIVFVTCTGNIPSDRIQTAINDGQPYPSYFANEEAGIYDPGHAVLALSVGAIAPPPHVTGRVATMSHIAQNGQPSPFTRTGPGITGEIKPELVDFGGNLVIDSGLGTVRSNPGTDILMASHQLTPSLAHRPGTSFAAPRVTHKLALLLHDLQQSGLQPSASLLKALLVNSAIQPDATCELHASLAEDMENMEARDLCRNLTGYGMPDVNRATDCDEHSIILFYQGEIQPDQIAFLDVPIPASLANTGNTVKRITVTTAHAPEVQRWGLESYLGSSLKWKLFRGDVSREDVVEQMSKEEDEAASAEEASGAEVDSDATLKEMQGDFKFNVRSRGCIQHDTFEWKQHRSTYSENHYTLAIGAYKNSQWGGRSQQPIPFAVVVRIEDESRSAQIYTEIRQTIETQVQQQVQAQAETRV